MLTDLRGALRMLTRQRVIAVSAIATVALGMAANTAVFAVLYNVLVRPLPFPEPDRLVRVYGVDDEMGGDELPLFPPAFSALSEERSSPLELAGMVADPELIFQVDDGQGEPLQARGAVVSARLFALLGVRAAVGRVFRPEEDRSGEQEVALLGHTLWSRRYGGDAAIVGTTVRLNDRPFKVIGVLPKSFELPRGVEIWVPNPERAPAVRNLAVPVFAYFDVIGRLRSDVSLEAAQEQLDARYRQVLETYPQALAAERLRLVPLHEDLTRGAGATLTLLQAAGAAVLLICCANVAGLLLVRGVRRRGELAMRAILGARPGRLVRQLAVEHGLLFFLGGLVGIGSAALALRLMGLGAPPEWLPPADLRLDPVTLAYSVGLAILAGLIFGSLPASGAIGADLTRAVREGESPGGGRHRRVGEALVIGEIALALALLVGAGLVTKSLLGLQGRDLGFRADRVLASQVTLLASRYPDPEQRTRFFESLRRELAGLPGVAAVGGAQFFFVSEGVYENRITGLTGGGDDFRDDRPVAASFVTPGYFAALAIPMVAGRPFTDGSIERGEAEAVVARGLADRLWPRTGALGQRLELEGRWWTVVGVAGDVSHPDPGDASVPVLYLPYSLSRLATGQMTFLVRSTGDPTRLIQGIHQRVSGLDSQQTIAPPMLLSQIVDRASGAQRYGSRLLGVFAILALAIGAVGVYGVLAYTVALRRREMGIRLALGARPATLRRSVMARGLALGLLGIGFGAFVAVGLGRIVASLLYGIRSADPGVWLVAIVATALMTMAAAWIPARRAAALDPAAVLRER